MAKITDLLEDALTYPDYEKRINFLLAGLLSADANNTPEKEDKNMRYLEEIYRYCCDYTGDKSDHVKSIANRIKPYIFPGQ